MLSNTLSSQLAQQFVASIHFAHKRHDLQTLGPNDKIRSVKSEEEKEGAHASPFPSRINALPAPAGRKHG